MTPETGVFTDIFFYTNCSHKMYSFYRSVPKSYVYDCNRTAYSCYDADVTVAARNMFFMHPPEEHMFEEQICAVNVTFDGVDLMLNRSFGEAEEQWLSTALDIMYGRDLDLNLEMNRYGDPTTNLPSNLK